MATVLIVDDEQHIRLLIEQALEELEDEGVEVAAAIRADPANAGTTVIMLTAKGQAVDREQGLAAGVDAYLTKPFDPDDLLARARAALGLGGEVD